MLSGCMGPAAASGVPDVSGVDLAGIVANNAVECRARLSRGASRFQ
jgi:hypothetical protein